jgi:hypothetical protein
MSKAGYLQGKSALSNRMPKGLYQEWHSFAKSHFQIVECPTAVVTYLNVTTSPNSMIGTPTATPGPSEAITSTYEVFLNYFRQHEANLVYHRDARSHLNSHVTSTGIPTNRRRHIPSDIAWKADVIAGDQSTWQRFICCFRNVLIRLAALCSCSQRML